MMLSDFISPDLMVARSVNLERDMGIKATLRHYHLTGKGLEIVSRLVAALNGERVRAWSLTGPYGMGKSSFANFLMALCGPQADEETKLAKRMLRDADKVLARELHHALGKLFARTRGLFRVAVTSSFESINQTLANGLRRALADIKDLYPQSSRDISRLIARAEELCTHAVPETTRLVELFQSIRKVHGTPIALVIDEFGKNLEYMARFPAQGDLFVLQALAESEDIFVWVCLHQAFEEYTSRLSARQLQEWGKIQGRFEDISFVEPKSEMIRFICETLTRKSNDRFLCRAVQDWAEYYHKKAIELDLPELKNLDVRTIERLYPLHPLTAVVLPELCMRFAQNDRTLFAFLCSGEPSALPAYLGSEKVDPASRHTVTFGLERLYDYFLSYSSTALMNRPESHRWIEIHDIIERARDVDPFQFRVLKVIGLLNLISGPSRFRSSDRLVSFAFLRPQSSPKVAQQNLRQAIDENVEKGILIYREYADEYRLWEGTDFDIPAAVRERKALLTTQSLDTVLRETLPLTPLTPSKHSYVTGTLRHFERRWCDLSQLSAESAQCSTKEMDGLLLYCFGREEAPASFPSRTPDGKPIVVCYTASEDQIRDLVLDAAAVRAVLKESPELTHDGVARKEAKFRAQAAEERLKGFLNALFAPANPEAAWHVLGEQRNPVSHRDLSRLLSDACDQTFSKCPVIRNELINRTRLSAAAARARRELMEAMVLNEVQEGLGLQGTGPEVAIYRTMLLAEGLHGEGNSGAWQFGPPKPGSHYYPIWEALSETAENAGDTAIPVVELIQLLRSPPFGLKEGPIPILLCLFLIVNSDELALYQEGAFIPWLGPEEMELMTKRPEYFAVRRFQQAKLRGQVFQLYTSLLKAQVSTENRQMRNPSLLGVVGPLVQFIKALNPYTLHTRSVSRHAQKVRHVLQHARDPFDLLYVDLPQAVGLPSFEDSEKVSAEDLAVFGERFAKAIVELRQAYPKLIDSIKQVVVHALGNGGDIASLRGQMKNRAANLLNRTGDPHLKPFLATMTGFTGTDQDWLVSVATIVSQRPVDSWRESDLQSFAVRMRDFAGRFHAMETLIARTEHLLPEREDGREPRMVMLTKPDGEIASNIVWKNDASVRKAHHAVDKLIEEHGTDRSALETIYVLLSERLLSEMLETGEEGDNG